MIIAVRKSTRRTEGWLYSPELKTFFCSESHRATSDLMSTDYAKRCRLSGRSLMKGWLARMSEQEHNPSPSARLYSSTYSSTTTTTTNILNRVFLLYYASGANS